MNSSVERAVAQRADDAQSIARMSSPGKYGREPRMSEPRPRRPLCIAPKDRPISRRRGTSVKTESVCATRLLLGRRCERARFVRLGTRRRRETTSLELVDRLVPADAARLREEARPEVDPVQQHGNEQELDVLRQDEVASVQKRPSARDALEREAAAYRAADRDVLVLACRTHEIDDPPLQQLVDVHVLHRSPQLPHVTDVDYRLELSERMTVALLRDDPHLVRGARVAELRLDEEAVELRFRQRERPLELDRVLGRHQKEGIGDLARNAVDSHLSLGHRLEHRRLRLRRRTVDLVDEDDVREDRPGTKLEVALLLVEHRQARDVRRLEVRRALNA